MGQNAGGNIDADPDFVSPGHWDLNGVWVDGDYNIQSSSPCAEAGTSSGAPSVDRNGKSRPYPDYGNFDMGAYEYHP
jgi:hypothetical protein